MPYVPAVVVSSSCFALELASGLRHVTLPCHSCFLFCRGCCLGVAVAPAHALALLEKLIVIHLFCHALYGARRIVAVCTRACHWILSSVISAQATWQFFKMGFHVLRSRFVPGSPNWGGGLHFTLLIEIVFAFAVFPLRAVYLAHLLLLGLAAQSSPFA